MFLPSPALTSEVHFTCAPPQSTPTVRIQLSEVLVALSYALDITEGQPEGHALRTCGIGMRLADEIGLVGEQRAALYYALLLKDLGCTSNTTRIAQQLGICDLANRRNIRLSNWSDLPGMPLAHEQRPDAKHTIVEHAIQIMRAGMGDGSLLTQSMFVTRCDRGAQIAQMIGLPGEAVAAIRTIDEHWDGRGLPNGISGDEIPIIARIVSLAQTFDLFRTTYGHEHAYAMARQRSGAWFDPALVQAIEHFASDTGFWRRLAQLRFGSVGALEPLPYVLNATPDQVDRLAEGFAQVIDARSPWTYRHSAHVAAIADGVAKAMGLPAELRVTLHRAALLHDIGKLGIPNSILNKPGRLDEHEFKLVRMHPIHTQRILEQVGAFRDMAPVAAAHHERLDGTGYPFRLRADEIPALTQILAVADVAESLSVDRPYRRALTPAELLDMLRGEAGVRLSADAVDAFASVMAA